MKCAKLTFTHTFCISYAGDRTITANFCNGSMTPFNGTYSFLPGENVIITCSVSAGGVVWRSSQFTNVALVEVGESDSTLGEAIVFNLTSELSEPQCATSVATITNIQEVQLQDLDLSCGSLEVAVTSLNIDVTGKQ